MNGWKRTQFTDRGPDPTRSVTWAHKAAGVEIIEFQGVYQTTPSFGQTTDFLGEELHKILEEKHAFQEEMREEARAQAGYPDDEIYGGE